MGKKKAAPVVEFKAPPPEKRDYQWDEIAKQVKRRPGTPALVHRDLPSSVPWAANAGRISTISPARGFRARAIGGYDRKCEDGKVRRYVREMWLTYSAEDDTTRKTKQNGAK